MDHSIATQMSVSQVGQTVSSRMSFVNLLEELLTECDYHFPVEIDSAVRKVVAGIESLQTVKLSYFVLEIAVMQVR